MPPGSPPEGEGIEDCGPGKPEPPPEGEPPEGAPPPPELPDGGEPPGIPPPWGPDIGDWLAHAARPAAVPTTSQ
jgi:hypothetical protein